MPRHTVGMIELHTFEYALAAGHANSLTIDNSLPMARQNRAGPTSCLVFVCIDRWAIRGILRFVNHDLLIALENADERTAELLLLEARVLLIEVILLAG